MRSYGPDEEAAQRAAEEDATFLTSVITGDLAEAEKRILDGAPASCLDEQRRTPLHFAAYNDDREMAALLCDYGADVEAPDASVPPRL